MLNNGNPQDQPIAQAATRRPARAWAAEIIDAWVDRRPTAEIIERIPEHLRPLAKRMAECTRAAIITHAANPISPPPPDEHGKRKPWKLAQLYAAVARYKKARR